VQALVRVDGGHVYSPAISDYPFASEEIGTPSVRSRPTEDVYLTLAATPAKPGDPVVIGVIVEPLVTWIWVGGGVIIAGAILAAWPGRRRKPSDPVSAPAAAREPAETAHAVAIERQPAVLRMEGQL
jgi:cytochrome c-type biogenesis protein CcmF